MLTFKYELRLNGVWTDITSYVRDTPVSVKRGASDESPKVTPQKAKLKLENADDRFNPRNPMGPYYGALIRNTPLRIFAVVDGVDYPRFYGEVYGFEPRWNENRSNCWVDIDAAGVLRRVVQNADEPKSYYRQIMGSNAVANHTAKYYWPLEEGGEATEGLPEIGVGAATLTYPSVKKTWGAGQMNDWFPNGLQLINGQELNLPCDMRGSSGSAWEMTAIVNFDSDTGVLVFEINCGVQVWQVRLSSATNQIRVIYPDGGFATSSFTVDLKDVGPVWVTFRLSYAAGVITPLVAWERVAIEANAVNISLSSSWPVALEFPRFARVWNESGVDANITVSNVSFAECQTGTTGMANTLVISRGARGESPQDRLVRLSADKGISADINTAMTAYNAMGRQFVKSYEDQLKEIAASVDGLIYESIVDAGIIIEPGYYEFGSPIIDYTELAGPIEPTEDDKDTVNQVVVKNLESGSFILSKQTGEMSIDQIGLFASKIEPNTWYQSLAASLGYYKLAEGTFNSPRFPQITVSAAATPDRYADFLTLGINSNIRLWGADPAGYFDELYLRVIGYEETWTQSDHRITFNVVPHDIGSLKYTVQTHQQLSRLDMHDCTTSALVNSTATTINVETPTSRWTTTSGDWPFDIMIAGEHITVTAVSNVDSNTQQFTVTRSVNGVVKSLPAGSKVELFPGNYLGIY